MKLLLAALLVLALLPASAAAQQGSDAVNWKVEGHGMIFAGDGGPVCQSPQSTPNGTEFVCASTPAGNLGNCPPPPQTPGATCVLTFRAQTSDGWEFLGWTGGRCPGGLVFMCTITVSATNCTGGTENVCSIRHNGPFAIGARFRDRRAPTITGPTGPAQVAIDDTGRQRFTFATDEDAGLPRFECALDGRPFAACASPHVADGILNGVHVFCVRATDRSGQASTNAPCLRWEQQTRNTATIVTHPDAASRSADAGFTYASNKAERLTFECALDAGAFGACPGTGVRLSGLGDGAHRFSVRSVFRGELDGPAVRRLSEVASFSWTIDTTPPETSITAGPADGSVISDVAPAFSFGASEDGSSFTCGVDDGPAVPCVSPFSAPVLASGEHTVTITATDAFGNVDPTPAVRRFSLAVFVPAPVDRDRDGFAVAQDCNDADPAINPGAREVPGNRVDEDCDGAAAPFPRVLALVTHSGNAYKTETRFSRMRFSEVPPGGKAELRCTARRKSACPFSRRAVKLVRGAGNGLTKKERRRGLTLGVGATLDARITAPQMVGRVRRFKIAKLDYPKGETLCLPPGTTKPGRCPAA